MYVGSYAICVLNWNWWLTQDHFPIKHCSQRTHRCSARVVGREEYSLVLVSRYSTVRSGTLTWREWGLWPKQLQEIARGNNIFSHGLSESQISEYFGLFSGLMFGEVNFCLGQGEIISVSGCPSVNNILEGVIEPRSASHSPSGAPFQYQIRSLIVRSREATRLPVEIIVSLWNLTSTLAAVLPRCLSNFRAIGLF